LPARIVLLVTSPRLPAGLLTAQAWDLVRTNAVFAGGDSAVTAALRAAGADVTVTADGVTDLLAAASASGTAVWLAGPTGDEDLARTLGLRLAREPALAELELMYGSWDPPGARLLDAVAVIDRLAGPGGDPWKRQQTHQSLAKYMIEEVYEAFDAIDAEDYDALRDELGDVLLQVVLHSRMAEDLPDGQAWNVDDVAGGLVDKMIRRNPHVFGDAPAETVDEITAQWEQIKAAEQPARGITEGIPMALPALALAAKVIARAGKAGVPLAGEPSGLTEDEIGRRLWDLVAAAGDVDAEAALRRMVIRQIAQIDGS
jgi:NTP pyrophosphatase (non-canonical NTP hydrolase)